MKDPYLIPGQICEVWNGKEKPDYPCILRFNGYSRLGELQDMPFSVWSNYRPIGTEWDFAPKWALDPENKNVCSTVDSNGRIKLWNGKPKITIPKQGKNRLLDQGIWAWRAGIKYKVDCGYCPDKSRYVGDAWKEKSLRMRPEWVKLG